MRKQVDYQVIYRQKERHAAAADHRANEKVQQEKEVLEAMEDANEKEVENHIGILYYEPHWYFPSSAYIAVVMTCSQSPTAG